MISRSILPVALIVLAALGSRAGDIPAQSFVDGEFGKAVIARKLAVTGHVSEVCSKTLGRSYPFSAIQYWVDSGKTIWVLATKGRHGLIKAAFVVEKGRLSKSRVLADKERRGRPIRSRLYLRQFDGVAIGSKGKLDRNIQAITGATISSTAMTKMALLALKLDRLNPDDGAKGEDR